MSILRDNTVDLAMRLRNPEVQAYVADQIEEAQLQVPLFNRLDILADVCPGTLPLWVLELTQWQREAALQNFMWAKDAKNVFLYVKRDSVENEAIFQVSGVVASQAVMPFNTFQESVILRFLTYGHCGLLTCACRLNGIDSPTPPAHQYIVLFAPENAYFKRVIQAIRNVHVTAELSQADGVVRPQFDFKVGDDCALLASTPVSTPRKLLSEDDEPLMLTDDQDPKRVATRYAQTRGNVFLMDNQVDVFIAARTEECVLASFFFFSRVLIVTAGPVSIPNTAKPWLVRHCVLGKLCVATSGSGLFLLDNRPSCAPCSTRFSLSTLTSPR